MPYVRVEPDFHLEHQGVEVFHLHDAGDSSPNRYWFTTNPDNADEFYGHQCKGQFDARLLAARWADTPNTGEWEDYWKPRFTREQEAIEALIRGAIDTGNI